MPPLNLKTRKTGSYREQREAFEDRVLRFDPGVTSSTSIIIYNAPCHLRVAFKVPTLNSTKATLIC